MRLCIKCEKKIDDADYKMIAVDVPYVNIYLHKVCYIEMGGYDRIVADFTENTALVYNYSSKLKYGRKK